MLANVLLSIGQGLFCVWWFSGAGAQGDWFEQSICVNYKSKTIWFCRPNNQRPHHPHEGCAMHAPGVAPPQSSAVPRGLLLLRLRRRPQPSRASVFDREVVPAEFGRRSSRPSAFGLPRPLPRPVLFGLDMTFFFYFGCRHFVLQICKFPESQTKLQTFEGSNWQSIIKLNPNQEFVGDGAVGAAILLPHARAVLRKEESVPPAILLQG